MTRPSGDDGGAGGPCMVLGYDRSESSRHAARWAARELAAGGKLVIVYACRGAAHAAEPAQQRRRAPRDGPRDPR